MHSAKLGAVCSLLSLPVETSRRNREQWFSAGRLAQLRQQRLQRLLHKARAAPFYRLVVPDTLAPTLASLRELPIITKRDIAAEGLDAFLTAGREGLMSITTSGSTGAPAVFLRSAREETEFSARWWRVYSAYGGRLGDRLLNLGRTNSAPRAGAVNVMRKAGLLPRIVTVSVAAPAAEAAHALFQLRPGFVTGFAIGVEALAEYLLEHEMVIRKPKAVMCGAMEVTHHCRQVVEAAFHAPAVNVYGTNEFGVIAWECPLTRGALHVNEDAFELEIVDGNEPVPDGTVGEVVVTALTLSRMPLIRFRTGDVAARIAAPCRCGRGLGLMTPVSGRTAHSIRTSRGGFITAPLLASAFGASGAYAWARRFQVHEEAGSRLRVLIELRRPPCIEEGASLLNQLAIVTAYEYALELELLDALPLAPTGRFQYVVPLLADAQAKAAEPAL